jgi:hypothetical protein
MAAELYRWDPSSQTGVFLFISAHRRTPTALLTSVFETIEGHLTMRERPEGSIFFNLTDQFLDRRIREGRAQRAWTYWL